VSTFQLERLDNGLRILTAPMESAQSVTCAIMLAAGSRYETEDTNGIAHFSEHMFFKGTERRPTARDISMEIDAIGGEFNAFTGKEYTGYYVKCAAESRDVALDVLVDMLRNSKFAPDEIEREKGVIIEEMNMYFDTPRDFISGVYEELLYGDQPLGWDIIGRKETIRGATQDTFHSYLDHWYKPSGWSSASAGKLGDGLHERIQELLATCPRPRRASPSASS
jgi:predicted Zn-dependent peptidase